jgi:hypothetical protein
MKRILIVSESHLIRTFVTRTLKKLREDEGMEISFDCLVTAVKNQSEIDFLKENFSNVFVNEIKPNWKTKIPKLRFLFFYFNLIKLSYSLKKYDYVHFHFMHYYFVLLVLILKKKSQKLILTFYGSDFNQIENFKHWCNKISVSRANIIAAESPVFLMQVNDKYNLIASNNIRPIILLPIMPVMESLLKINDNNFKTIARAKLFIKEEKVIVCGYCGDEIMQFNFMIDALLAQKDNLQGALIVFPMTYGRNVLENQVYVEERMATSGLSFRILKDYLSNEEVQMIRFVADIFILVSKRDQAASTLYEHLYSGSFVITGKWLPYEHIDEMGIYYKRIEDVSKLSEALGDTLTNFESEKNKANDNAIKVKEFVGWEYNKANWIGVYTN